MQVINEDHYLPEVTYTSGPHALDKAKVGTRYVVVGIRTLVDPNNPADLKQVHAQSSHHVGRDAARHQSQAEGGAHVPNAPRRNAQAKGLDNIDQAMGKMRKELSDD